MIHPLESRYRTEISNLFEEETRMKLMLEIEVAIAKVHTENKLISNEDYQKILEGSKKVSIELSRLKRKM